jgi:hypothetical protein
MQPSNNETVSELVIQNESLTQTLNRFLKKHFNETIIEDTYQNRLFLARQQRLDWASYSAITISCIGLILAILFFVQSSGFFIILKAIIKAIREGKISKAMGRLLVRRMLKQRIYVDPELMILLDEE